MSTKVQGHLPAMLLNSIEPQQAKASIAVNSIEAHALPVDAVSLFFETVAACGMSDKEAAYTMALDPAQLSRVKAGQARLPFDAMWRLPNRFWVMFRDRIDAAKQLTAENRRAIQRARLLEVIGLLLEEVA